MIVATLLVASAVRRRTPHPKRARRFIPAACAILFAAAPLSGQVIPDTAAVRDAAAAGDGAAAEETLVVGEAMRFGVQFGPVQLGHSELAVAAREMVDGEEVYRLEVDFQAPIPFFRIHDRQTSWVARGPLRSLRYDRFIHEGRRRRSWRAHLDEPGGQLRVELMEGDDASPAGPDEVGPPPEVALPEAPLDDLAILYEMRRRVGSGETSFVVDRYYLADRAPAEFELERRDRTRVPAGRFDTYVLKSVVPGMLMFRPESDARIHVAVEAPHPIVMITTQTRHGRLTLYLREFLPGEARP